VEASQPEPKTAEPRVFSLANVRFAVNSTLA